MSQSADPDLERDDPARGRTDDQTRFSGPGATQDRSRPDQQGQWRQGGLTTGENVPYGGGGRDPLHAERRGQAVGVPQDRVEAGNYGTSTVTGLGSRPDDQEIHGDGGFSAKPPMTERVLGTLVLLPLSLYRT